MIHRLRFLSIVFFVFSLDRILKTLVVRMYSEGQGFPVLAGIFHITRVNNTGAAFGVLKGSGNFLLTVSFSLVIALAVYLFLNGRRALIPWTGALVLAGALGNLYDRVRFGYVIDFLDFRVWPVFNVADASICLGVSLAVFHLLKTKRLSKGN